MDRLTTDKPVKEMSMYELAHNSCFVKDGEAYYRDFDKEISARDLIRNTSLQVGHLEKGCAELIDDESFDATMIDDLQHDMTNYAGLIALFYRNLWAMADLRETLKQYEDLGTVEELRQAKGKMTAKSRIIKEGKYYCCICERFAKTSGHCSNCGQLLY